MCDKFTLCVIFRITLWWQGLMRNRWTTVYFICSVIFFLFKFIVISRVPYIQFCHPMLAWQAIYLKYAEQGNCSTTGTISSIVFPLCEIPCVHLVLLTSNTSSDRYLLRCVLMLHHAHASMLSSVHTGAVFFCFVNDFAESSRTFYQNNDVHNTRKTYCPDRCDKSK